MFKHSQDAHKKYSDHNRSHFILLIIIMGLVLLIVASISYAAYLFIDATRISKASGVHITKNLALAISELKGNLYNDSSRGIKDWMIHSEDAHGYKIKHPNDWEMQKTTEGFLHLKKYVSSDSRNSSLAAHIEVGVISLTAGGNLEKAVVERGIAWNSSWKESLIAGRMGIRTGKVKTAEGPFRDVVFWKNEEQQRVFYLEATYYIDKTLEFENIFDKIITEFEFI